MEPDELDQPRDLGLGAAEAERATAAAESAGDHRQVEHQRCVSENEFGEVNDHIGLHPNRSRESGAPASLRRSILVAPAPQRGRLVIEVDYVKNL